jgi:hypothetical protein
VRRCVNWLQGDVSTRQSGSSTCRMQILCQRFCIQDGRIKKLFCIRQRPRSCEGVRTLSHSKLAALKACSPTDRPIECKIFWIRRTNIFDPEYFAFNWAQASRRTTPALAPALAPALLMDCYCAHTLFRSRHTHVL